MAAKRSVVMKVLVLLMTSVLAAIHAKDVTTLEYDDFLPVTENYTRLHADRDTTEEDHRQCRTSLHAELSSSKAKREQMLRNVLTRRRQILTQRLSNEFAHRLFNRTPYSTNDASAKDAAADVLEGEETKHSVYVTVPNDSNDKSEIANENETTRTTTSSTSEIPKDNLKKELSARVSAPSQADSPSEKVSTTTEKSEAKEETKEIATAASPVSSALLALPTDQKSSDADARRKNIISMSESLYNHFRPVESNIPVEDMSQFLYFGQKLHPEIQNMTNNNSVEVIPTTSSIANSRRRYYTKRTGSTVGGAATATPTEAAAITKLEEIANEEMNIAVEQRTVEKNKVSKIKNPFRSPNLHYRKARPIDSTVASNVIPMKESSENSTELELRLKIESSAADNPSAHAVVVQDQSSLAPRFRDGGSAATHVPSEVRNATDSTQIPNRPVISVNTNRYELDNEKESIVESEIIVEQANRTGPKNGSATHVESVATTRSKTADKQNPSDALSRNDSSPMQVHEDSSKVDAYGAIADAFGEDTTAIASETIIRSSSSREDNNIESTSRLTTNSMLPAISTASNSRETSTLRIIVTEDGLKRNLSPDSASRNTVKSMESAKETDAVVINDGPLPSTTTTTISSMNTFVESPPSTGDGTIERPTKATVATTTATKTRTEGNHHPQAHQPRYQEQPQQQKRQQQQQQHVYAYTITNVTRLLRNYTGPGLSREEQGGPQRSTGTGEITTGSAQHHQPPPPTTLLFPRAGSSIAVGSDGSGASAARGSGGSSSSSSSNGISSSGIGGGIEASRSTAGLSTGTTVESAGGTSAVSLIVGERQRRVLATISPQLPQRTAARTTTSSLTSNSSKSHPSLVVRSRSGQASNRGSIRWNQKATNNADSEAATTERRFLRKSASAVLNQRIGGAAASDDEPSSSSIPKRRRLTYHQPFVYNRRIKGSMLLRSNQEQVTSSDRTVETDSSPVVDGKGKHSVVDKRKDETRGSVETGRLDGVKQTSSANTDARNTSSSSFERNSSSVMVSNRQQQVDRPQKTIIEKLPTADDGEVTESVWPNKKVENPDTKDKSDTSSDVTTVKNEQSVANVDTKECNGAVCDDESLTERRMNETSSPVEESVERSMAPSPVFPVTPKILVETSKISSKETFTLSPTESLNQVPVTKTPEANRPFGKAANLDPSEIQKMYRSNSGGNGTSPKPDSSSVSVPNERNNVSDGTTSGVISTVPSSTPSSSTVEALKSVERSPEVKARNLPDKSKEKDDILPIMHLYNTSDIFNDSNTVNFPSRTVELPLDKSSPSANVSDASATMTQEQSRTQANKSSTRLPNPKDSTTGDSQTGSPPNPKRDRPEEANREANFQHSTTPSSRGPTATGANGGGNNNRTRHRLNHHHHPVVHDYNDSMYYPASELNRTFFETGLISVNPKESVNVSEVISKRHDGDAIASQETVAVVSYILATLVVFPIAVGVGLILRRLIIRNRKVLEESDTSSEISCRKDALNLENGDFKTSIEKAITKLPRIQHLCHEAEKPPPPPAQESRWEFPRDKLRLQTVLGQGNFGQVWKAEADDLSGHQGTTRLVAVKTVKEGASEREKEDLVRELEIMQQLGSHPNVVTLLGCCTEEEPHYLILEYVMYGKLLAYLRDHRTRQDFYNFSEDSAALTSRDLTVFGYCVARGMEYLASKKIIHRDLAARNVLVDHNKLCKIADFGMSRFANEDGEVTETRHGRNALPIRWMAPESLIYSLFTTKTDVWSFGILMWEIVTLGSTPYPDMTAREVMRNVQNGYRLERPSHCRSELFRVISRCWHADPDRRPEFQILRRDLAQLLEDNMNGHYVDLESFASECTD